MNEKNFGTQGVDAQGLGSQSATFWFFSGPVVFDILNQKKLIPYKCREKGWKRLKMYFRQ